MSTMGHGAPGPTPKTIGLWGAPSSGKTTFLAALYVAVTRKPGMNIVGVDDPSTDFLISSTRTLTHDHKFPAATQQAVAYSWTLNLKTTVEITEPAGRFSKKTITTTTVVPSRFNIDLRDAPGGYFGNQQAQPPQAQRVNYGGVGSPAAGATPAVSNQTEMMDYLSGCDGLLLLIDPVREQKFGDAHEYFQTTLLKIAQRKLTAPGAAPQLPHHVAVCITKFDYADVYGFAKLNGYRVYDEDDDPYLFPRVHDANAEQFFRHYCRTSPNSEAEMLCSALQGYFDPSRVRFFVTSAIGFYLGQSTRFLDRDPQNAEDINGVATIRGKIYPINVLEPILWLGERVLVGN